MPEFGAALSASTGLPYYGEGGRDGGGRYLHAADPRRSFVASWHANKKGFNLQPWRRQLIVYPPQSAKWQEQIFGRSHRYGQDKSVRVEIMATSGGTFNAIDASIAESGFGRQTVGPSHKMLRATVTRDAPRLTVRNRYRWGGADVEAEPPTLEETERLARRVRASVRVPPARRSPPLAMATLKKIAFDGCIPRSRMLRIT
jgi:hypothetical protein